MHFRLWERLWGLNTQPKKKNKYETIFLRGKRPAINETPLRFYLRDYHLRNDVP
jgi:hypothetical protein